jgi:putative MATE family efflux protein
MQERVLTEGSPTLWQSLREAVRGSHQDFTQGSISRAVLLLATPMVLEMVMESLFAIANVFWVSRLGANAIATVGLTESMLTLVFSVAIGVSMSTTAMVARRIGEKDPQGAATAAVQAIILGVTVAILMGVPGYWFAPRLLEWMGAPADLVAMGRRYTGIMLGGSITVLLLFLNNAIFRGAGDAAVAMRVLWTSNWINIVLDPCLIFGLGPFPEMGVTGAAVSTVIGRGSGVLYQFYLLGRGTERIRIRRSDLKIVPDVLARLIRVSLTGVMQFAIAHTSWIALVRIISGFGATAVAGYTIGLRIFLFAILPSWGMSGAAATMMGQNLGAGKPERAERAVYLTATYNTIFLALVAVVFIGVPEALVGLFTSDAGVVPHAVDCLRIIGYGNVVYGFAMVLVQAFNGAGDTVTPTLINVVGFWMCEIPLAYWLAYPMGMGVRGVFASIPVAEVVILLLGWAMFRRGGWRTRKI